MTVYGVTQILLFLAIVVAAAKPVGAYMARVNPATYPNPGYHYFSAKVAKTGNILNLAKSIQVSTPTQYGFWTAAQGMAYSQLNPDAPAQTTLSSINNAAAYINPSLRVFRGHSSTLLDRPGA